jgi:hypothetical protein
MLTKRKIINIRILCFENKYIKTKNLLIKPNRGGIPAKDNNKKTMKIDTNGKFQKNFNSFKVFMYCISNIKKIKNILINKYIYTIILKKINEKEYSFKYSEK